MIVELSSTVRFEAAHHLPTMPVEHKCRRLHGHSYYIEIVVRGLVDPSTGMFIDYAAIQAAWAPLHDVLDHRLLNEIEGLEIPTSEMLAQWIWDRLELDGLIRISVRETCTEQCIYEGK
jgi:6-pyruvoyltetrahydropterin/6-carboxytetrahydropterin synthase